MYEIVPCTQYVEKMYSNNSGNCSSHVQLAARQYVIVVAQLPGIYGSEPTESEDAAINPWQLGYRCYISHLIGPHCGARNTVHSNCRSKQN